MDQQVRQFEGAELVPEYWRLSTVQTADDVLFLGEPTIREMIRAWRYDAASLSSQIKRVSDELSFLQGKTARDIIELSTQYEDPEFNWDQIGTPRGPGDWSTDPEPLDAASMNRKRGSTTFNVCGWCKYAGGGLGRYDMMITTSCGLLTSSDMEVSGKPIQRDPLLPEAQGLMWEAEGQIVPVEPGEEASSVITEAKAAFKRLNALNPGIDMILKRKGGSIAEPETERRFNTPCFFKYADEQTFEQVRQGLQQNLDRLVAEKSGVDKKIRFLVRLVKRAERKPVLPQHRSYDWFNVNDHLVSYIGGWPERLTNDVWVTGVVINGYRHHDGVVSVRYDQKVHSGENLDGYGGGSGTGRPEVILAWEYEYLRAHPDFAKVWAESSDAREFNASDFIAALQF